MDLNILLLIAPFFRVLKTQRGPLSSISQYDMYAIIIGMPHCIRIYWDISYISSRSAMMKDDGVLLGDFFLLW